MNTDQAFDTRHHFSRVVARFVGAGFVVFLAIVVLNLRTASATPEEAFIQNLFLDLLGRQPSPADQQVWLNFLTVNGNNPSTRQQIALALLTSGEYRTNLVQSFYMRFLGRSASGGELTPWLNLLGGGATDEQVMAGILGSNEYFNLAGGTNTGFVNRIFQDLLGRSPSAGELATFVNMLNITPRATVALNILSSGEYRTILVQGFFQKFLGRPASSSDLTTFVGLLSGGATDEEVIAAIVSSDEYYAKATAVTATPTSTAAAGGTPTPTMTGTTTTATATPTRTATPGATSTATIALAGVAALIVPPPPHVGDAIGPVSGTQRNLARARAAEDARAAAAAQAARDTSGQGGTTSPLRPPNTGDAGLASE